MGFSLSHNFSFWNLYYVLIRFEFLNWSKRFASKSCYTFKLQYVDGRVGLEPTESADLESAALPTWLPPNIFFIFYFYIYYNK